MADSSGESLPETLATVLLQMLECTHPAERIAQSGGPSGILQWCNACGAARALGGPSPAWYRHGTAEAIDRLLRRDAIPRAVAPGKDRPK